MSIPEVTLRVESVRSNSPVATGTTLRIQRSPSIIGRALDCELLLSDPSVSRLHLRVDLERDRIALTNLSRRSLTIIDGRRVEAGQRFESRYRPLSLILGTVECVLGVSFETDEPTWQQLASELTAEDLGHAKRTLDIPGLTSPPNDHGLDGRIVNDVPADPMAPFAPVTSDVFLSVVEGRAAAAVSIRGNWMELPRMTALALAALAHQPGRPVSEETIERASGSESMVTKHVSIIRSAVRDLIETGALRKQDVIRQIAYYPAFDEAELDLLSLEELMRKLILSRRGFGYILHVRPDDVSFGQSR